MGAMPQQLALAENLGWFPSTTGQLAKVCHSSSLYVVHRYTCSTRPQKYTVNMF